MIRSLVKSMAIYAVIATVVLGSGKMIATGIGTMINAANEMNNAVDYCITTIVDDSDVK